MAVSQTSRIFLPDPFAVGPSHYAALAELTLVPEVKP